MQISYGNQEIFDLACKGMLRQGRKSLNESNFCAYRGRDGLKCAVGHIIPDNLYMEEFDERDGEHYTSVMRKLRDHIMVEDDRGLTLLGRLQLVHDHRSPGCWPGELAEIASEFSLDDSVIEKTLGV